MKRKVSDKNGCGNNQYLNNQCITSLFKWRPSTLSWFFVSSVTPPLFCRLILRNYANLCAVIAVGGTVSPSLNDQALFLNYIVNVSKLRMHVQTLLFLVTTLHAVTANVSITFPESSDSENLLMQKPSEEKSENNPLKGMANHVANLGLKTLREIVGGNTNVIISPFNVYSCLGLLHLGASGNTKEEIRRVIGPISENHTVSEIVRSNEGVSYASALFLDYGFVPRKQFVDAAVAEFQASVLNVNVSDGEKAKDVINSWVSNHTNGTISHLLQSRLDPASKMVVVSALLFKGRWVHSFPTAATAPGKFELGNTSVDVPFMHLLASVPLVRNPQFDAISLPYIDSHGMTMHVILPKAHGAPAIKKLISQLNANSLKKLRKESLNEEIFIVMPKMKIEGRLSLTDSLKKQGISDMFNPSRANFTAFVEDSSGLYVSQIYHSIHFEMDEEGTTASAATAAILTKSSRFIFRTNRPFIFVITDESDFVLFMGVIMNPVP